MIIVVLGWPQRMSLQRTLLIASIFSVRSMGLKLLRVRPLGIASLSEPLLRVVVLHGKGNNGPNYRNKLTPLIDAAARQKDLNIEWIFPTAPYALADDRIRLNTEPKPARPVGLEGDYAWWTLPDGVRSFEADSYGGIEDSLCKLETLLVKGPNSMQFAEGQTIETYTRTNDGRLTVVTSGDDENKQKPVVSTTILMGHSQGAMIAAVILARLITKQGSVFSQELNKSESATTVVSCAILSGAAWPKPFGSLLESLRGDTINNNDIRNSNNHDDVAETTTTATTAGGGGGGGRPWTLHTIGTQDRVNPPQQSRYIAECFGFKKAVGGSLDLGAGTMVNNNIGSGTLVSSIVSGDVMVMNHPGGHVLPLDDQSVHTYISLFKHTLLGCPR